MKQVYACKIVEEGKSRWFPFNKETGLPELYASKEMLKQYMEDTMAKLKDSQKRALTLDKRLDELLNSLNSLTKEEQEELDNIDEGFIIDYKVIPTSYDIISIDIL